MSGTTTPEYWLRGPVPQIPSLLQPVAHALLQARDEVNEIMNGFPEEKLWEQPAGSASCGFHLQHLRGVLDRLFTYARNEELTTEQAAALAAEGKPYDSANTVKELLAAFNKQVDISLEQLKNTDETTILQTRPVGRLKIPSTVIGLLFHATEHTMRHTGQLLVTAKIAENGKL